MGLLRDKPCDGVYKYGKILANKDKIGHIKLKTFGIKVVKEDGTELDTRRFPLQLVYAPTGLVFKEVHDSLKRYTVDSVIKAYQEAKRLKFECLNGNFDIDVKAYEDWKEVVLGGDKNSQAKRNLLGLGDYKMTPEGALLWLEPGRGGKCVIPKNCRELKPGCIKFHRGVFELEINENIRKSAVKAIEVDRYSTKLIMIYIRK
ncbi:MAG: hypothetical protein LBM93_12205 [Oscillospiraceae bacterium]|jgi:hypothetical protein|nr:hypothetical protein [Oscillospiraceae bacterium]